MGFTKSLLLPLLCLLPLVNADNHSSDLGVLPPLTSCPKGFHLSGKSCIKTKEAPQKTTCEAGYRLQDGLCLKTNFVSALPTCSSSAVLDNNKCKVHETQQPFPSCPHGFEMETDGCVKTTKKVARVSCPVGFRKQELDGGVSCFKESKVKADAVCPEHYTPGRAGTCTLVESSPTVSSCPHGFSLHLSTDGDFCQKEQKSEISLTCPKGFSSTHAHKQKKDKTPEHVACVRSSKVPSIPSCPPPSVLEGLRCVTFNTSSPSLSCPLGFTIQGSKCVRFEEHEPKLTCSLGSLYHKETGLCRQTKLSRADRLCPEGSSASGKGCEVVEFAEQEMKCAADKKQVGHLCVDRQQKPVSHDCQEGFKPKHFSGKKEKVCYKEKTVKADLVCGSSETFVKGKCVEFETVPSSSSCDSNSALYEGFCISTEKANRGEGCAKGFKLSYGVCSKETTVKPSFVCPDGSPAGSLKKCEVLTSSAPIVGCPWGYENNGKGCVKLEEAHPVYSCPSGFKLIHGICIPKKGIEGKKGKSLGGKFAEKKLDVKALSQKMAQKKSDLAQKKQEKKGKKVEKLEKVVEDKKLLPKLHK